MPATPHVRTGLAIALLALLAVVQPGAQSNPTFPADRVLTHREQATHVRGWVERRFDTLLPMLMKRTGLDMWIVISREYNDDPVFRSMAPLTTFSSRRRTILVFSLADDRVERFSVGRFDYDRLFTLVQTPNDGQWEGLRKLVDARNPATIGVNTSNAWNHADGLTANERDQLVATLGPAHAGRIRSAEMLAVGWLEAKLPEETAAYRHVMTVAHQIIREAFSNAVITPGVTTTDDVVWWMRQRVATLGLGSWFHPSVSIQRAGGEVPASRIILPGDMLHTDFGIVYLGFSTDTQHNAYVLRPGETAAPEGLRRALAQANALQDIVMDEIRPGRTGNEILAASLARMREGRINGTVYSHPIGLHGHGAGPLIGLWDYQDGVPGRGDARIIPGMWWSIELQATTAVPEWGNQQIRMA
ncbi:MAG TPA: M24 family metallopeptidase, partial [Vicinamibacterales bacterium]|nr:M24 family metallopeptidase [Vicinamibacterales bacterium]